MSSNNLSLFFHHQKHQNDKSISNKVAFHESAKADAGVGALRVSSGEIGIVAVGVDERGIGRSVGRLEGPGRGWILSSRDKFAHNSPERLRLSTFGQFC